MKIRNILSIAAAGMLLAACSSNSGSNSVASADASMSAKGDSLVYCFGQMRGAEYLREAASDTTMLSASAKQEYLRGVKAGLDAVKANKEAYNKGLFLGMQMAMNINQFADDYGVKLSNKVFLESVTEAITSDSVVDGNQMQSKFYRLMKEFNDEKEARDKAAATEALKTAAAGKKMAEIAENLYGDIKLAEGAKLKDGDRINVEIKISTLAGKTIDAPFPKNLVIGQRLNNTPLTAAFTALSSGQTGTFLTTAQALFGQRCGQLGLEPAEVLQLDITPTLE